MKRILKIAAWVIGIGIAAYALIMGGMVLLFWLGGLANKGVFG